MKKACVIGWPIKHSRSPLIHGYWLEKYGIESRYEKVAVRPAELADFLKQLEQNGFVGCNVTVPHKETVFAQADVVHDEANAVNAANTLWLEGGKLHADNTDIYGFLAHLQQSAPDWLQGGTVAVLGAGGAARAIVYGLLKSGAASEVRLCNRTIERARELQSFFKDHKITVVDWDGRHRALVGCSLVVNTTSLGMEGSPSLDLSLEALPRDAVVADIVYAPLETELLAAARQKGCRTVDGLGMLLHQAVPGFEHWFGVRPEVTDELRDLVIADLTG
ncbi:MAG: shikimate dehydrogenase [Hyphomicrobiaceae bacterium]|nr:shikimate dehydrogenase [Hyphomicrobiaceae bacterium]